MASDSQVVLDVDGPRVTIVREKASWSSSGVWRTCGVLLAVALCAAAAVCFSQNKVRRRNRDVTPLCSVLIFTSSITQLLFLSRSFNRRRTNQTRPKVSSIRLLFIKSSLVTFRSEPSSEIRDANVSFLSSHQKSSTLSGRFPRLRRLRSISQVRPES